MSATLTIEDKALRYNKLRSFMSSEGIDAIICSGEGACTYIGGEFYNTRWVNMLFFKDSDPVALIAQPGRE